MTQSSRKYSVVCNSDPRRFRIRRWAWLALLLVPMLSAIGCGEPAATVFIDNGGEAMMIVRVDGQPAATIEAGEFTLLRLQPGEHKFDVLCAGETLFDGTKTLDTAKGFLNPRQYIFNPGNEHRYASCKVVYGSQTFFDATDSLIVKFAEQQTGQEVDTARLQFLQIKRYAEPMPDSVWFEVPGGISYILRDAPEHIYTQTGSESRRVLTRIAATDHTQLLSCYEIENPTERDVDALADAASNALDSMSLLDPIY